MIRFCHDKPLIDEIEVSRTTTLRASYVDTPLVNRLSRIGIIGTTQQYGGGVLDVHGSHIVLFVCGVHTHSIGSRRNDWVSNQSH